MEVKLHKYERTNYGYALYSRMLWRSHISKLIKTDKKSSNQKRAHSCMIETQTSVTKAVGWVEENENLYPWVHMNCRWIP